MASPSFLTNLTSTLTSGVFQTLRYWPLFLTGAFAYFNVKNLPGFWHIRVLRGIYYHLWYNPHSGGPEDLFKPVITRSYCTIWERDWNRHKSNSTYFTDLDVARSHAMSALIHKGIRRLNAGETEKVPPQAAKAPGFYMLVLGGVSCLFHKEVAPLQEYEIHTRLLTWDRSWIYCVSHVVEKGIILPEGYALQPWKKGTPPADGNARASAKAAYGGYDEYAEEEDDDDDDHSPDLSQHIFASSMARYAFRKGSHRLNPELLLEMAQLLPPKPAVQGGSVTHTNGGPREVMQGNRGASGARGVTWESVEKERVRGLKVARSFGLLDLLPNELRTGGALGEYGDYW